ncbi:BTAD domain-containing putative transcriptional regulator [Mesorhizobium sp.]|uniref:BTAD domain-containing putative transcriptional regulator n=1 Tax=Mesorhizobium sp. TaxID=1871066 RepID=UPI000FE5214B|nr:BTAD domain-containing putative transcriptional regulator [Mesorhizobium sp.]RWM30917.1 MAG: adenylate cyclase [Mesorhizobium sp.]RWM41777.1 MAG: adenylate cyclase [Mesorhizobium sp.]TIO78615.1 MAG: adenylate cyclase [Mesorhizobium sp.]TIO87735.1 MAG: adenylate cyclase [Mesorhizobium sp.]TJV54154.1 MAG: adenylate cyclase [Mesorhizobium sp.]
MHIRLLGGIEVVSAGGKPLHFATRKTSLLFAALVLAGPRGLRRDRAAAMLWAGSGEQQARNSLRQALVDIRRLFPSTGDEAIRIEGNADTIWLATNADEADIWMFDRKIAADDGTSLATAADLYRGDLLDGLSSPGEIEDWLAPLRANYARKALDLAERLSLLPKLDSRVEQACETLAERLVTLDPCAEQAHRALIRIFRRRGKTNDAFRQFLVCKEALKRELGVEPEEATRALVERIEAEPTAKGRPPEIEPSGLEVKAEPPRPAVSVPEKPSIAVLPFQNMSDDAEQEYFTDGVVEEITTALSHVNWLFVIARNSAFAYKGQAVEVTRVARELGVRYVLEGSVRRAGSRLRVAGQLVEAAAGVTLWADRFEGDVSEVFELQDLVASSVVGAISPRLEQAEMARAKRKPTESLDAYDHYLRGMASLYRWTREGLEEALPQFYKAIELDPDFAAAEGAAAWCYFWRMANRWMTDRQKETAEVSRLVGKVAISGQDDAVALAFGGLALGYVTGDYEAALALADRALVLNPNCATAWSASGYLKACYDDPDIAIEHLSRARRLSPLDPLTFFMQTCTAFAHFVAGRYDVAWPLAEAASRTQPYYLTGLRVAAACNAMAGRLDAASKHIARSLALDPELTLANLTHVAGHIRPAYFAKYFEALRLAGLPE